MGGTKGRRKRGEKDKENQWFWNEEKSRSKIKSTI